MEVRNPGVKTPGYCHPSRWDFAASHPVLFSTPFGAALLFRAQILHEGSTAGMVSLARSCGSAITIVKQSREI
jgi:hypothetical protein